MLALLPDAQALSAGYSGVMGGVVPKAGDEGVAGKTDVSLGGAGVEGRLAAAEKMAVDQDAVGPGSVAPGWLVDLQATLGAGASFVLRSYRISHQCLVNCFR